MTTPRFAFRTLLVTALLTGLGLISLGTTPAFAQESQQGQPEYAQTYASALQTAQQAEQLEGSNMEQAVELYAEAYMQLEQAAAGARDEGNLDHADQISTTAAKLAYAAGKLLYDADQVDAAMEHFQYGMELDPSFAANRQAYNAAEQSMRRGPVIAASRALNNGQPREALELLEGVEETSDVLFYKAAAYAAINEDAQALTYAQQAIASGELSTSRQARMYLLIGEAHIQQGNTAEAQTSLARARDLGSAQISSRAAALLEQIN